MQQQPEHMRALERRNGARARAARRAGAELRLGRVGRNAHSSATRPPARAVAAGGAGRGRLAAENAMLKAALENARKTIHEAAAERDDLRKRARKK